MTIRPIFFLSFFAALPALAQNSPPAGGQRPMGPPPEAFEVCKGKQDGEAVSLQTPHGKQQGNCRLVWVPGQAGAPADRPGQPPGR